VLIFRYSHTLNLTPLLPYIQSLSLQSQSSAGPEKKPYLANDIPPSLARDPLPPSAGGSGVDKTTLLSFLIKGLLLAMEEHPIMRSRVKTTAGGAGAGGGKEERWLEISRDGIVAVAVSGKFKIWIAGPRPPLMPHPGAWQVHRPELTPRPHIRPLDPFFTPPTSLYPTF
jgi:2-oxoisovalerate dehydrogenase E2 component (dihydrolipoyl transacylase)